MLTKEKPSVKISTEQIGMAASKKEANDAQSGLRRDDERLPSDSA
jgi:hypothetical protein